MDTARIQEGHGLQHYRGDCFVLDVWWTKSGLNTSYVHVLIKLGKGDIIILSFWEKLFTFLVNFEMNERATSKHMFFYCYDIYLSTE